MAASVDPVVTSLGMANGLRLGYPIVDDTGHQLGSAFGDFHLSMGGGMNMGPVDNHAIFVLDRRGIVRWKAVVPDTMHVADRDVIAALKRI